MKKSIKAALTQVGVMFMIAGAATVLHKTGVIDEDTTTRVLMVTIGLLIAWQSNATPKEAPTASARRRAINRLTGWAFFMSGLAYAGIWIFAPIGPATVWSMVPLLLAGAAVISVCLSTRNRAVKVAD